MSTWLTTIVINSARMKLRRRLSQVQFVLDEPWGEQNLSLANTLSDTRPNPEEAYRKRQIATKLAHASRNSAPLAISRLDKRVQRRFDVILQEHSHKR